MRSNPGSSALWTWAVWTLILSTSSPSSMSPCQVERPLVAFMSWVSSWSAASSAETAAWEIFPTHALTYITNELIWQAPEVDRTAVHFRVSVGMKMEAKVRNATPLAWGCSQEGHTPSECHLQTLYTTWLCWAGPHWLSVDLWLIKRRPRSTKVISFQTPVSYCSQLQRRSE